MIYYYILALGIIATVVFLLIRVKEGGVKGTIAKALASTLFIATAVGASAVSGITDLTFPSYIIVGLVFGLLGDIWLDLKWAYPKDNDTYTFAGFISFAVGHLIFISGLLTKYADSSKPIYILLPLAAAIVLGIATVALEKVMKLKYGKFKTVSACYASILIYFTLLAGSLALMNSFDVKALNVIFIGGVFFLISDLILSGTYFGEGKDRPIDVITNHVSYYIAQYLIASSLLFLA